MGSRMVSALLLATAGKISRSAGAPDPYRQNKMIPVWVWGFFRTTCSLPLGAPLFDQFETATQAVAAKVSCSGIGHARPSVPNK
jgi:hypothetical protein